MQLTKFNLFFIGVISSVLIFSACNRDSDATPESCSDGILNGTELGVDCGGDCAPCVTETTVAEDKANIQKTLDEVLSCVRDFKSSNSTDVFLREFLGMTDGEVLNEDWINDMTTDLEDILDVDALENSNRLDVAYHAGTHRYVHATGGWEKIDDTNDKIIFEFPSTSAKTTNNAILRLENYNDSQVTIDGETMYLPTSLKLDLTVDGAKLVEVDLKKVTYANNADFEIPVEVDLSVFFDPMSMTLKVERNSTTEFSMDMRMVDANLCNYKLLADVELEDDDFENLSEDSFKSIEVQVGVGALTIQSLAGLAELISIDDPTQSQINTFLDLDMLFNGVKIADLEYDENEETLNIFYKDGTSESGENYFTSFWEDLELLVEEFTGQW